jgi:hypothetical protein
VGGVGAPNRIELVQKRRDVELGDVDGESEPVTTPSRGDSARSRQDGTDVVEFRTDAGQVFAIPIPGTETEVIRSRISGIIAAEIARFPHRIDADEVPLRIARRHDAFETALPPRRRRKTPNRSDGRQRCAKIHRNHRGKETAQRVELSVIRNLLLVTIRFLHGIEAKHGVAESCRRAAARDGGAEGTTLEQGYARPWSQLAEQAIAVRELAQNRIGREVINLKSGTCPVIPNWAVTLSRVRVHTIVLKVTSTLLNTRSELGTMKSAAWVLVR